MKQIYYIYSLIDDTNKIVYIGCSTKPVERFYSHVKRKPCATKRNGTGYFYGRTDLSLRILFSTTNKSKALLAEGKHKELNGFVWSEKAKTDKQLYVCASGGKVTMAKLNKIPHTCTCGRVIKGVGALAMHQRGKGH
jgi:predicted GIY-YIG superfamily endonuclease